MNNAMDIPLNRAPLSLLLAALIAADFAAAHPEEHARLIAQAVAMLARGKS